MPKKSDPPKPRAKLRGIKGGGSWRIRTAVNGFADRRLATRPRNLVVADLSAK